MLKHNLLLLPPNHGEFVEGDVGQLAVGQFQQDHVAIHAVVEVPLEMQAVPSPLGANDFSGGERGPLPRPNGDRPFDFHVFAGAQFVVSPSLDLATIAMAHRYDKPVMPGALTPTEVMQAYRFGSSVVKIFPGSLAGPSYVKALKGPFPYIPMMPTGGVECTEASLKAWFGAGVVAVGVGSNLIRKDLLFDVTLPAKQIA